MNTIAAKLTETLYRRPLHYFISLPLLISLFALCSCESDNGDPFESLPETITLKAGESYSFLAGAEYTGYSTPVYVSSADKYYQLIPQTKGMVRIKGLTMTALSGGSTRISVYEGEKAENLVGSFTLKVLPTESIVIRSGEFMALADIFPDWDDDDLLGFYPVDYSHAVMTSSDSRPGIRGIAPGLTYVNQDLSIPTYEHIASIEVNVIPLNESLPFTIPADELFDNIRGLSEAEVRSHFASFELIDTSADFYFSNGFYKALTYRYTEGNLKSFSVLLAKHYGSLTSTEVTYSAGMVSFNPDFDTDYIFYSLMSHLVPVHDSDGNIVSFRNPDDGMIFMPCRSWSSLVISR